jgi:glycosyltransferase involved in cell wall biosynthesis
MSSQPRIAVVSPFLDKRHGTERCICEQIEHLAKDYEIHVYSTRVEDIDLSQIVWHHIADIPGPHLLKYLWWFSANRVRRLWDFHFRRLRYDAIYSPGVNCLDADFISVHIVFAEFYRQVQDELRLSRNRLRLWPLLIHRHLYYWLIVFLEGRIYARKDLPLAAISSKTASDLLRFYGRDTNVSVIYYGIDPQVFNPNLRDQLRDTARSTLRFPQDAFVLLLVGNDWKKKGLRSLLEAVGILQDPRLWVAVVGRDDPSPYRPILDRLNLEERMRYLPMRSDVHFYYAAADCYVGPSLEDAFALPPIEAMACGLPVIVSRQAGVSEIITHEKDGLILEDPTDSLQLSKWIQRLLNDSELRRSMSEHAVRTARNYTWDQNGRELRVILERVLERKSSKN